MASHAHNRPHEAAKQGSELVARKLSWFPWDVVRVETDEDWKLMTDEEKGLFIRLLNHSWLNEGLPSDEGDLSRLIGKPLTHAKWARRVYKKFVSRDGRLVNEVQEEFRTHAKDKSRKATESIRTRYERSTDDPIRAYDSISNSISDSLREELPKKLCADKDGAFVAFKEQADKAGMTAPDDEWIRLEYSFPRMSFEDQLAATDGIRKRIENGQYSILNSKYVPGAGRYIAQRLWTEPLRNGNGKSPPGSEKSRQLVEVKKQLENL